MKRKTVKVNVKTKQKDKNFVLMSDDKIIILPEHPSLECEVWVYTYSISQSIQYDIATENIERRLYESHGYSSIKVFSDKMENILRTIRFTINAKQVPILLDEYLKDYYNFDCIFKGFKIISTKDAFNAFINNHTKRSIDFNLSLLWHQLPSDLIEKISYVK